jgi:pseudomonalisin
MKLLDKPKILLTAMVVITLAGCSAGDGGGGTTLAQPHDLSAVRKSQSVLDPAKSIHTVFVLNPNDRPGLDQFVADIQNPNNSNYRHPLTSKEVTARFGPTTAQVNAVIAFLKGSGFTNVTVAGNNLLIEADAPANTVETALQTNLAQYILADGTPAHANTTAVTLPSSLGGIVQDVLGLDTVTRAQTFTGPGTTTPIIPTNFPAIYNVGNTPAATNVIVGIIAEGTLTQTIADLSTFESQYPTLPVVPTTVTYVGTQSTDTANTDEWDLDSQNIVAMSQGVKQLNFYVSQDMTWQYLATAINAAVVANTAQVINMSIGGCEAQASVSIDTIFETAIAQGQTFVVSSGDGVPKGQNGYIAAGCTGASVAYPASSPYVVAVGGSTLNTNSNGTYGSETAWNGSGGGISTRETIPSWQSIVPLLSTNAHRGVPDLAFDADPNSGAMIIFNGAPTTRGGTSLAAPLFTATWARMLQNCGNLGFAAPILYAYQNLHPAMFNDVTSGNNTGYNAAAGWDFVTGWGTPNISNMYAAVCPTNAAYYELVQQIYLGYLGRPVEPGGLNY